MAKTPTISGVLLGMGMGALGGAISGAGAKNATNIAKKLTSLGGLSKGFVDSAISIGKNELIERVINTSLIRSFTYTNVYTGIMSLKSILKG